VLDWLVRAPVLWGVGVVLVLGVLWGVLGLGRLARWR
jgi:hypothetical protein